MYNYEKYIGHRFIYYNEGKNEITILIGGHVYTEKTEAFSITSVNLTSLRTECPSLE